MKEGAVITRWSKIALVFSIAFFSTLVVFNNLTDYGSNFLFVSHVLSMDTTFPDNNGMWRAITSPFLHHAAYVVIIVTEFLVALLCWIGTFKLYRARRDGSQFNQEKKLAIGGLTLGILLWFTGFMAIGGEWFLMWQSEVWNGQQAAFRLAALIGIILVYLVAPDSEDSA
jgi:predicted small integral membrane protein